MSEQGTVLESGAVRFERLLPGPIERVWSFLTEADTRARWVCGGAAESRAGGRIELFYKHSLITDEPPPERYRKMNEEGHLSVATVTEWEPPHRFGFTWHGMGESHVAFELSKVGDRVRLVLTHRRLASKGDMANFSSGWHLHLGLLEDELLGQPHRGFWSRQPALLADYEARYASLPEPGAAA